MQMLLDMPNNVFHENIESSESMPMHINYLKNVLEIEMKELFDLVNSTKKCEIFTNRHHFLCKNFTLPLNMEKHIVAIN